MALTISFTKDVYGRAKSGDVQTLSDVLAMTFVNAGEAVVVFVLSYWGKF